MPRMLIVLVLTIVSMIGVAHAQEAKPEAAEKASAPQSPRLLIPNKYLERVQKDREASRQIAVRFDRNEVSVLQLEYEKERSQTAVIAATFVSEACESEVSSNDWANRKERDVSLCFRVQSLPRNFGTYAVVIEHHHVTELTETKINSYRYPNPETFEDHRVSISGAKAGANLYVLRVETQDSAGNKTLSEGFSHIVLIQEDSIKDSQRLSQVESQVRHVGKIALLDMQANPRMTFQISEALDPSLVQVSIRRRGAREFGKAAGAGMGSPFLSQETSAIGWKLLFRGGIADEKPAGVSLSKDDAGLWTLEIAYRGSLTSTHLPYRDSQDYLIDVTHPNYPKRLASFECRVTAKVDLDGEGYLELRWPLVNVTRSRAIDMNAK